MPDKFNDALLQAASSLSVLGCLFIIVSYWLFKESRKFSRRLLVYLSIADLLSAGSYLFASLINTQGDTPSTACVVQGFFIQFSVLSSYLWTACLAWHLYRIIWKQHPHCDEFESQYHWLSWGIPGLTVLYMLVKLLLGYRSMGTSDRAWCWIDNDTEKGWSVSGSVEQFVLFYVPTAFVFLFNAGVYIFLARRVKVVLGDGMESKIKRRLLMYLLVFFFVIIWGFINRIFQALSSHHHINSALLSCEAFFGPLQGFLNAFVYGYSGVVRQRYRELLGLAPPMAAPKASSFLLEDSSSRTSMTSAISASRSRSVVASGAMEGDQLRSFLTSSSYGTNAGPV